MYRINFNKMTANTLVITDLNGQKFQVDKHVWEEFQSSFPDVNVYVGTGARYVMFHPPGGYPQYFHRWTMWTFGPTYDPARSTVDHINRDSLDNRLENLRWANMSEQNYNRGKFVRAERNVPCLWEGFTEQDVVCGIYYHFPENNQAGYFVVDYKGVKKNMDKDKDIPMIQKYARALRYLLDSGVEDRQDRVEELRRQLSFVENKMGSEVAPKKSRHSARQFVELKDASGKTYTVMQWIRGDEVLSAAIFDTDVFPQVNALAPDKDLAVRVNGAHSSLAKFIYTCVMGNSCALPDGSHGDVFCKNGVKGDLRCCNLVLRPKGSNPRQSLEAQDAFERFASGDTSVTIGFETPEGNQLGYHVEKIYKKDRTTFDYILFCDPQDAFIIKQLPMTRDRNNIKVSLRTRNEKNICAGIPADRLVTLERSAGTQLTTCMLPAFVHYFLDGNLPESKEDFEMVNTYTNQLGDVRRKNIWKGKVKSNMNPFNVAAFYKGLGYSFLPFRVSAIDSKRQVTKKILSLDSTETMKLGAWNAKDFPEKAVQVLTSKYGTEYTEKNEEFNLMCSTYLSIVADN